MVNGHLLVTCTKYLSYVEMCACVYEYNHMLYAEFFIFVMMIDRLSTWIWLFLQELSRVPCYVELCRSESLLGRRRSKQKPADCCLPEWAEVIGWICRFCRCTFSGKKV